MARARFSTAPMETPSYSPPMAPIVVIFAFIRFPLLCITHLQGYVQPLARNSDHQHRRRRRPTPSIGGHPTLHLSLHKSTRNPRLNPPVRGFYPLISRRSQSRSLGYGQSPWNSRKPNPLARTQSLIHPLTSHKCLTSPSPAPQRNTIAHPSPREAPRRSCGSHPLQPSPLRNLHLCLSVSRLPSEARR